MNDQQTDLGVDVTAVGPGCWRVTVSGEIDMATAPSLASQLDSLTSEPGVSVVVDLTGVSFMDSSGLRTVVRSATAAEDSGGSLVINGVSGSVARLLEVTGLTERLRVTGTDPTGS